MIIISHGTGHKSFQFHCQECGCFFEAYKRECHRVIFRGLFNALAAKCPECGENVFENDEDRDFYDRLRGNWIKNGSND